VFEVLPDGEEDDLREKGTNSAAFGFKVVALFGRLSFVSLVKEPFLDKFISLLKWNERKKEKDVYMHKKRLTQRITLLSCSRLYPKPVKHFHLIILIS
jgi:hypothetical protein